MSGTKLGGKKASITNKRLHGKNFYKEIGSIGGQNGTTGGFFANRELAKSAGSITRSHLIPKPAQSTG